MANNQKKKHRNNQPSHHGAGYPSSSGEAMCKIPDHVTVRLEATTEENKRYSEERENRNFQLTTAKRLNKYTAIGVACAFLSFVGVLIAIYQSHRSLHIDQRAWIGPGQNIASLPGDSDVQPMLLMQIVNTGKTPALRTRINASVDELLTTANPTFSQKPDFPEDFKEGNNPISLAIVMPNSGFPVSVKIIPRPTYSITAPGAKFIHYLHGRVDFEDVFGVPHWWVFCYSRESLSQSDIHWQPCEKHNETDKNQE